MVAFAGMAPTASVQGPGYHDRVRAEKRAAILEAATRLFLEHGYSGVSLARIAEAAGVSSATLFKRFPTKAALFEAIVTEYWALPGHEAVEPEPGNPRKGLTTIGRDYVELLSQPQMVSLFRLVIAEAPRFPELAKAHFALGKAPYFEGVRAYLREEDAIGTLRVADAGSATTQFLGMVANFAFWPRLLLPNWSPSKAALRKAVDEAVETMLARYSA